MWGAVSALSGGPASEEHVERAGWWEAVEKLPGGFVCACGLSEEEAVMDG